MDFEARLKQANARLKAARCRVRLGRSGNKLWLRATLPPKPNNQGNRPTQQRIYLGVAANPAGLSVAEAEAKTIAAELELGSFSWKGRSQCGRSPQSVAEWVEDFEQDYFRRRRRSPQTETTWRTDYAAVFRQLPAMAALSSATVVAAVEATNPDSKSRRRCCMALGALARFAGIKVDLTRYAGRYSPRRVQPRELPSDEAISQCRERLASEAWRWAYGCVAVFGLRPHEIFYIGTIANGICEVRGGKTGARKVWALYPEWCHDWQLDRKIPPDCSGRDNAALGHRMAQALRRAEMPFTAYDLRHCWARRAIAFGLDVSLAAAQMGHSVQVHTSTYQAWIGDDLHQRAYAIALANPNRPIAP